MCRAHSDVSRDSGVGHDREAIALEHCGQHNFQLLRGKACSDTHMASRAEWQVLIDRTIERDPALRFETIRLVIEFWHTLCDKLAVDDVGVFRQCEATKLAWFTGDPYAERSWWEQAQALFDYTIEHRHLSKLLNRWC